MSIKLVAEVREHAPADISAGERLVLVWIAEQSRDEDRWLDNGNFIEARTCFPGNEDLARWCGVSVDGLRKILARLAARGLDVRVQQATDKNGRPVYAVRGFRMVLRLPDLGSTPVPPNATVDENWTVGGTSVPGQGGPASQVRGDERPTSGGTSVPPTRDLPRDLSRDVPLSVVHGENRAATDAPSMRGIDDHEDDITWITRILRGLTPDEQALAEQRIAQRLNRFKICDEIKARRKDQKRQREAVPW